MKIYTTELPELSILSNYTAARTGLDALQGLLFNATDDGLTVTATDLNIGLQLKLFGQISAGGSLIVPTAAAGLLVNAEQITIETNENNEILITKAGFKGKLKGMAAAEYPDIPTPKLKNQFSINVSDFERLLEIAAFAAKGDGSHTWASGLHLSWKPQKNSVKVFARAADGFSLGVAFTKAESGKSEGEALVPAAAIKGIRDLLKYAEDDEKVKVGLGKNILIVKIKAGYAWAQLMAEKYPTEQIMGQLKSQDPKTASFVAGLDDFAFAANQVASIVKATKSSNQNAVLTFGSDEINIAISDSEIGGGQAVFPVTSDDDYEEVFGTSTVKKGYNLPTLTKSVSAAGKISGGEQASVSLPQNPNRPIVIKANSNKMTVYALVMPVNLDQLEQAE